ncbi:hypothetical protein ACIBK9_19980 [Nonomuraea sp. NPDC050227]|uniref:hypothetical protein n=1 Tax=Nonomuraea sp. NPDC050227 TaxID=3364360 RepID=UPI00379E96B3
MTPSGPARTAARRTRSALVAALVVLGGTLAAGVVVHRAVTSLTVSAYDEAEGAVPEGVTVFDDGVPAVAGLDADLLRALRRAAAEAAGDGADRRPSQDRGTPR